MKSDSSSPRRLSPSLRVGRAAVLSALALIALLASGVGVTGPAGLGRGLAVVLTLILVPIVGIDRDRRAWMTALLLFSLGVAAANLRPGYEGSAALAAMLLAALHVGAARRRLVPAAAVGALVAFVAFSAAAHGVDWLWALPQGYARLASAAAERICGRPIRWGASAAGTAVASLGLLLALTTSGRRQPRGNGLAIALALAVPFFTTILGALIYRDVATAKASFGATFPFLLQLTFVPLVALVNVVDPAPAPVFWRVGSGGNRGFRRSSLTVLPVAFMLLFLPALRPSADPRSERFNRIAIIDEGVSPGAFEAATWERLSFASAGIFGEYGHLLERLGNQVSLQQRPIDAVRLSKTEILVLTNPNTPFAADELAAIEDFVTGGGSLLVMVDHADRKGPLGPANQLIGRYGMRFRGDMATETHGSRLGNIMVRDLGILPAATGAAEAQIRHGASLQVESPARPLIIGRTMFADLGIPGGDPGLQADREPLGDVVLAASAEVGAGRVLVFGDTSSLQSLALGRSAGFVSDLFGWLGGRRSSRPLFPWSALLIGVGSVLVGAGTWRRAWIPGTTPTVLALVCLIAGERAGAGGNARLIEELPAANVVVRHDDGLGYGDHDPLQRRSSEGLLYCAARDSFTGLSADLNAVEHWDHLKVVVIAAPGRPLDLATEDRLMDWVEAGGRLVVAAGYEESAALERLLGRLGLSILPEPLGAGPAPARAEAPDRKGPRFVEAWPLRLDAAVEADCETLCAADGRPLVVERRLGRGTATVIGDSWFFVDGNFEGESAADAANVALWRRIVAGK